MRNCHRSGDVTSYSVLRRTSRIVADKELEYIQQVQHLRELSSFYYISDIDMLCYVDDVTEILFEISDVNV